MHPSSSNVQAQYAVMQHFLHKKNEEAFNKFTTMRNARNCVTNYVISIKNIDKTFLKSSNQFIIKKKYVPEPQSIQHDIINIGVGRNRMKWEDQKYLRELRCESDDNQNKFNNNFHLDDDDYKEEDIYFNNYNELNVNNLNDNSPDYMIRIDRVNLVDAFYNLKCPFCSIKLQCIPLRNDSIALICFCYPKCLYPINYATKIYKTKFIWQNVKYIGPSIAIQNIDNIEKDSIHLKMFRGSNKLFQIWKRYQKKKWKQLNNRNRKKYQKYTNRMIKLQNDKPKLLQQIYEIQINRTLQNPGLIHRIKHVKHKINNQVSHSHSQKS